MKKLIALVLLASVAYAAGERSLPGEPLTKALNGTAVYLGTINVATPATEIDNTTTSTPFTITVGSNIMVQCDVAAYCVNLAATHANAVAAKMPKLAADEKYLLGLTRTSTGAVTCDSVTGAAVCKVFSVQ